MCSNRAPARPLCAALRVGRIPRMQAGQPGGYRAPVLAVLRPEAAHELRFLISAHEAGRRQPDDGAVEQQAKLAQQQRLPDDRCHHRDVHRIADIPYGPPTTRCCGAATGAGVPRPSTTKRTKACPTTTRPAMSSRPPHRRRGSQKGSGVRRCQPVSSHGMTPLTVPGASRKKTALPTMALERRIIASDVCVDRASVTPTYHVRRKPAHSPASCARLGVRLRPYSHNPER